MREDFDEIWIILRAERVADALGTDNDGAPYALRAGGLTGVARQVETIVFRFLKKVTKLMRGAARFVTTNANADDARILLA